MQFSDAVAVVGMSCRFAPDLDSPGKLWEFLIDGRDSVREMPERRWSSYAAASPQATNILRKTTRKGAFLDDIEGFDADFFGISPREADFLDPQQRIILELAWEALVDAGLPPHLLRGSETGVFVAANSNDYGRRLLEDVGRTGAYAVNGTTYYGIANRISYFLDLRGPSLAVDTACAGSLTALHLACQSLRIGETPVAIVGGVNIMASPTLNIALEAAGALAPDGKSKAFDKNADGYGRGEGAGVVVLKRLSDARRDGDQVLAIVAGSGVFQDGKSDGMMAPNGEAQEHMLRQAYRRAGVAPGAVGYVEAHGTGTPVGDREEAQALAAVFGGESRVDDPCLIGSVKPNIGHVEAGSGIAGVIKVILALGNEEIPPSLHDEPNPEFDWAGSGLRLVADRQEWPRGEQPRIAGVSSYGVGGSIAHVILKEAPVAAPEALRGANAELGTSVFPLSAASDGGVRALAATTAEWLAANPGVSLASVGNTLSRRRSHLAQRAAVVAGSTAELTERLRALAEGRPAPGVAKGRVPSAADGKVVWVFSGHGAQWSGMGRRLLVEEPVFAEAIDSLADVFRAELGWTPREAIVDGGPWSASHVQAMTFAMQIGLAAVWRRHGAKPAAVLGHSVGEIAAAVAAGALDVREAARFACRRAAALQPLAGRGGMAMAGLAFDEAERRLAGHDGVEAAIAASPGSTVVSGDRAAVERLAAEWKTDGIGIWTVDTDIAFHSEHVDEVVANVAAAAAELTPRTPDVPLYSTALTDVRSAAPRDTAYWVANLRQPVRCAQAVTAAIEDGYRLFLEVSSHPVVTHSIKETLDHLDVEEAKVAFTMRRDQDEVATLLTNFAELHCEGADFDWAAEHPDTPLLALPAVAWQHRPYWIFGDDATGSNGVGGGHDPEKHSLLGGKMAVSGSPARVVWQTYLDMDCRPYPLSHEVVGVEITPAASIINTFAEAAVRDGKQAAITDIVLRTPLSVVPPRVVQIVSSENTLRLSTRLAEDGNAGEEHEWITHTTAAVEPGVRVTEGTIDTADLRDRLPEWSWEKVDTMFRRMGVGGYAFPWDLDELRRTDSEQLAVMTIEPGAPNAASWAHVIDGALTISAVVVTPEDAPVLWMSRSIEKVVFDGVPPAKIVVHSRRSPRSPRDTTDVLVADETGRIVCEVTGLRFAAVEHLGAAAAGPRDLVHEIAWKPLEPAETRRELRQVLLVGDPSVTGLLAARFEALGTRAVRVCGPDPHQDAARDCDCAADFGESMLSEPGAVVIAPSLARSGETLEAATERASWTVIRTLQRISEIASIAGDDFASQQVWALSRGVRKAVDEAALAHGPLWGVARIAAGERPELWGGAIDVDEVDEDTADRLLTLLRHAGGTEDVISLSGDATEVARLTTIERPSDGASLQCRATGTYLITGGLGGLGLEVAQWLADRGARRLLLAGRRGLPPRSDWDAVTDPQVRHQIDSVLALEAAGVTVRAVPVDITDEVDVARALDPANHGLPPIRGVIHAAGVVNDALIDKVDLDGLRDVLAPKASGGLVLHRLFPPGTLDFLVLFSSCGQFARLTGQTNYAAANSFLDALAAHRNAGGHSETTSIGWTSWLGVGMSESIASTMFEANARGLEAITASEAFRAWAFAERYDAPYQAVLRVLPLPARTTRVPMFRDLAAIDADAAEADGGTDVDWASLSAEEAHELITQEVREQVGAELNLAAEDVDLRRPLVELGVDSVMTVGLRVRLSRRFGLDLPPTILWAKPTVAALSAHVTEVLREPEAA
ncbi:polyketide synthase [Amycolatopsis roodepoortensis]|uniref:6-methylsalicylic acid synthase n=1 Tax=Amycolatopsis roodepoortensis TaxID=700274 RepID=A0ABR9L6R4_9PSEU|nr:polyketide synthase [Amycolatopsis roodepoortensis]MBE1576291.1 6-methylsalicylic acid synthase [Amycolatopsis roodepoortensis]